MRGLQVEQQKSSAEEAAQKGGPAYNFQRSAEQPTDTLNHGVGWPAGYTGMVKSQFRGSDDAVTFPFNIPENAFAASALKQLEALLVSIGQPALAAKASKLAADLDEGLLLLFLPRSRLCVE